MQQLTLDDCRAIDRTFQHPDGQRALSILENLFYTDCVHFGESGAERTYFALGARSVVEEIHKIMLRAQNGTD